MFKMMGGTSNSEQSLQEIIYLPRVQQAWPARKSCNSIRSCAHALMLRREMNQGPPEGGGREKGKGRTPFPRCKLGAFLDSRALASAHSPLTTPLPASTTAPPPSPHPSLFGVSHAMRSVLFGVSHAMRSGLFGVSHAVRSTLTGRFRGAFCASTSWHTSPAPSHPFRSPFCCQNITVDTFESKLHMQGAACWC